MRHAWWLPVLLANVLLGQARPEPMHWLRSTTALDSALVRMARSTHFAVVHFGDSHVQGGRFTGEVRRGLQARFGGKGRGVLFPYGRARSFDPAGYVSEAVGEWASLNVVATPPPGDLGLMGYVLQGDAPTAGLRISWKEELVATGSRSLHVWHGCGPMVPRPLVHGAPGSAARPCRPGGWTVSSWTLPAGASGFHLTLEGRGRWALHGFELIDGPMDGVRYHAAGVVGAQFTQLAAQQALVLEQLAELEPGAVVFSYGTNEAYARDLDTLDYVASVQNLLVAVRERLPKSALVVMTPPDTRAQGRIPPFQPAVLRALRAAATSSGAAFFDLHGAMGGDGALAAWHAAGLAAKDRLHFTPEGYVLQARLFTLALLQRLEVLRPGLCAGLDVDVDAARERLEAVLRSVSAAPSVIEQVHVVRSGESVYLIARRHGLDHRAVLRLNGLTERSVIRPGQRLRLR